MGESNLLCNVVQNLRRKLGNSAQYPRYILAEPRVGYRMGRGEDVKAPAGIDGSEVRPVLAIGAASGPSQML